MDPAILKIKNEKGRRVEPSGNGKSNFLLSKEEIQTIKRGRTIYTLGGKGRKVTCRGGKPSAGS